MAETFTSLYSVNGVPEDEVYQKIKNRLILIGEESPDDIGKSLIVEPAGHGYSVSLSIGGVRYSTTVRLKETVEEKYSFFLLTGEGKAYRLGCSLNGDYEVEQVFFWRIFSPRHVTSWHIGGLNLSNKGVHESPAGATYQYVTETLGGTKSEDYEQVRREYAVLA